MLRSKFWKKYLKSLFFYASVAPEKVSIFYYARLFLVKSAGDIG